MEVGGASVPPTPLPHRRSRAACLHLGEGSVETGGGMCPSGRPRRPTVVGEPRRGTKAHGRKRASAHWKRWSGATDSSVEQSPEVAGRSRQLAGRDRMTEGVALEGGLASARPTERRASLMKPTRASARVGVRKPVGASASASTAATSAGDRRVTSVAGRLNPGALLSEIPASVGVEGARSCRHPQLGASASDNQRDGEREVGFTR